MTKKVNMHEARTRLSEFGELAWKGERAIIATAGKPYLDLRPYRKAQVARLPGRFVGQIEISPDLDVA